MVVKDQARIKCASIKGIFRRRANKTHSSIVVREADERHASIGARLVACRSVTGCPSYQTSGLGAVLGD